jgi:hypothetical protein
VARKLDVFSGVFTSGFIDRTGEELWGTLGKSDGIVEGALWRCHCHHDTCSRMKKSLCILPILCILCVLYLGSNCACFVEKIGAFQDAFCAFPGHGVHDVYDVHGARGKCEDSVEAFGWMHVPSACSCVCMCARGSVELAIVRSVNK